MSSPDDNMIKYCLFGQYGGFGDHRLLEPMLEQSFGKDPDGDDYCKLIYSSESDRERRTDPRIVYVIETFRPQGYIIEKVKPCHWDYLLVTEYDGFESLEIDTRAYQLALETSSLKTVFFGVDFSTGEATDVYWYEKDVPWGKLFTKTIPGTEPAPSGPSFSYYRPGSFLRKGTFALK